jgi:lambda repressor-like predicted transcriptional regulator
VPVRVPHGLPHPTRATTRHPQYAHAGPRQNVAGRNANVRGECREAGCEREVTSRYRCENHYRQWMRANPGETLPQHAPKQRLPLAPLLGAVGPFYTFVERDRNQYESRAPLAERVGVSRRTVDRWFAARSLPWDMADVAAVAFGFHPLEIWGSDWVDLSFRAGTIEP